MLAAPERRVLSGLDHPVGKPDCAPVSLRFARRRSAVAVLLAASLLTACSPPGRNELLTGERLINAGRPAEAIEPLRAAVQAFATNAPACAQAWNYLGLAYHRSGQFAEAAQAYQTALDKDFNLFAARYNRGRLFLEQTNLPAAVNELTTYTAHVPDDPAGWLMLGKAQLRARLYEAADRNLQQALRLKPAPALQAEALNALGLSHAQRRQAREAFQYFEAALNRVTNYPPALLNEAILSQQLNDRSFALQKYSAYLAVAGDAPNAAALRAVTNQLTLALKPAVVVTNPPAIAQAVTNPPPVHTNVVAMARTSAPPVAVHTSPPPVVVKTSAPPVLVRTSPPPVLARTSEPPATVRTSPPPVVASKTEVPNKLTGTPPPAQTNAPETVAAAKAPPKTNATLVAAEPPEKASAAEPPLEKVTVSEGPAIVPGRELEAPAAETAGTAQSPSVAENTAATEPEYAGAEPKKRSFVAKLNPLSWFGSKEKKAGAETESAAKKKADDKRPTPIPPKASTTKAATSPAPARPTFPRYVYQSPPKPAAGNAAAAARLVEQGVAAHKAGRVGEALADYSQAVKADPASFNAQYNLAVAAFDIADWPRSLSAFEQALAIAPTDTRARYGFALALERAGYPVDAAGQLDQVLAREPANVTAHLALANLYATQLGDRAKAQEHYEKVLALQPDHPQAGMIRRWLGPLHQ